MFPVSNKRIFDGNQVLDKYHNNKEWVSSFPLNSNLKHKGMVHRFPTFDKSVKAILNKQSLKEKIVV